MENNNNNNVNGSPEKKTGGREQISHDDETPPPNATGEETIRTFSDDKKRGRGEGKSKSKSKSSKKVVRKNKKGELTDVPKGEPKCATCKKTFKSWKALFGHLRSHPERSYRGALPPPTAMELDLNRRSVEGHNLVSTLLSIAHEKKVAARFSTERMLSSSSSSSSSFTGFNIDLNQQPTIEEGTSSRSNKARLHIDLNALPGPETDHEDD